MTALNRWGLRLLFVVLFGGSILLLAAGFNAIGAILVTTLAIVGMIALGNILGGRTTPSRAPTFYDPDTALPGAAERRVQAGEGNGEATDP